MYFVLSPLVTLFDLLSREGIFLLPAEDEDLTVAKDLEGFDLRWNYFYVYGSCVGVGNIDICTISTDDLYCIVIVASNNDISSYDII